MQPNYTPEGVDAMIQFYRRNRIDEEARRKTEERPMGFCNDCQVGPTGTVTLCGPCANQLVLDQRRQLWTYKDRMDQARAALDLLGVALANHNHQWTDEERTAYEIATNAPNRSQRADAARALDALRDEHEVDPDLRL